MYCPVQQIILLQNKYNFKLDSILNNIYHIWKLWCSYIWISWPLINILFQLIFLLRREKLNKWLKPWKKYKQIYCIKLSNQYHDNNHSLICIFRFVEGIVGSFCFYDENCTEADIGSECLDNNCKCKLGYFFSELASVCLSSEFILFHTNNILTCYLGTAVLRCILLICGSSSWYLN